MISPFQFDHFSAIFPHEIAIEEREEERFFHRLAKANKASDDRAKDLCPDFPKENEGKRRAKWEVTGFEDGLAKLLLSCSHESIESAAQEKL